MDQNMTARKAFWHAFATVGMAALLVAGFLLYLAGPYSELWLAFAFIILVPALIMLPFLYRRYINGPRPPLTPQQHLRHAVWCAIMVVAYLVLYWRKWAHFKSVESWSYVGVWLVMSLNHLRQVHKKAVDSSPTQ